jgi:hypothetical protein
VSARSIASWLACCAYRLVFVATLATACISPQTGGEPSPLPTATGPAAPALLPTATATPIPTTTMEPESSPAPSASAPPALTATVLPATATATAPAQTPTPWPTVRSTPAASPIPTGLAPEPLPTLTVRLGERTDMIPGQTAVLEGAGIRAKLLEAHGPRKGCDDCPVRAVLEVSRNGESQTLGYSFSGNMVFELLQKASRKLAFGYVFVAARVAENSFSLLVEPVEP